MAKNRALRKKRSGKKGFLRRLVDFLILAVVLWLAFVLAGRSLRQVAITQIAELTNAKIKAKSIDFNFDGSVSIEKLVIKPEQVREYDDVILKAEKVYARFDLGSLLLVRPRLREITVNDFVFNAQYDLDTGQWNTAGLKFNIPKVGLVQMPGVRLERGTLQYCRVSNGEVKVVTKIPIDAKFAPAKETPAAYSFSVTTAEMAQAGKSTLNGTWQPGRITTTGGFSSANLPTLERAWDIKVLAADFSYDANSSYSLKMKIKDCVGTRSVGRDTVDFDETSFVKRWGAFDFLQGFFRRFCPVGQIDFDLDASGSLERLSDSKFSGKVYCKDVSIRDVNFPYLVEHITGEVDLTLSSASFSNLSGKHNDVDLTFDGWSKGFGADWQYEIRIRSDNMVLDSDLYDALNIQQKESWSVFSPSGTAAVDYTFSQQSPTRIQKNLNLGLIDVEATYEKFPYPLKNLVGDLSFEDDDITISDLVSRYNGRTISFNGTVTERNTERPIYDLSINAKDVPLDSELAEALPAKHRNFYEQYDMTGLADAEVKVFTPEPNAGATSFAADVSFKKTSLHLEQLPLVISDVSAKAVISPNSINLQDFTGQYNGGTISLAGQIQPTDEDEPSRYCMTVRAERMELNEDLIELLPTSLGEYISKLQPKGKVNLSADLNKSGGDGCPGHKLTVECLGNSLKYSFAKEAPDADSAAFNPAVYPLKDVTGKLIITADSIELDNITATVVNDAQATANAPTIKLNGQITLADDAFSGGRLALSANDISFDERLGLAMPEGLRDLYVKLAPVGRFDLNLNDIKISPTGDGEKDIGFAGVAKLKTCNLNIWPAVTGLDALLDVNCVYKTGGGFSDSRVSVFADSLQVSGKSMTSLKADLNYDSRRQSWATDSFIADCYGGKLTGKLEFKQPAAEPSEYLLQAGFNDIDLKQFLTEPNRNETRFVSASNGTDESQDAREQLQFNGQTSGKMSGSLSLTAGVGGSSSRLGRCRLIISDMYVGKPSPLAKLLYVLQLTESEDFIFEQMFVDSYIKENRLFFEKFDLSGKA
ncbi:MAG: AsmA family protein, partial [Planctomycetota bacterium]